MKMTFAIFILMLACSLCLLPDRASGKEISIKITIDPDRKPIEATVDLKDNPTPGTSLNSPVALKDIKDYNGFKFERDNYIRKHYEGYQIVGNGLSINKSGRIVQDVMLKNENEQYAVVYFDVDDVCRKCRKLDDKNLEKRIRQLIKAEKSRKREINPYQVPKDKK